MDRTFLLCGVLFGGIGALFTGLGAAMVPLAMQVSPVFLVFLLLGLAFFGLGVWMLTWRWRRRRRCAALLETGQLVWAELVDVRLDTRFAVNGRHPYVLVCEAEDPRAGEICQFASDGVWTDPMPYVRPGLSVPVYVDPDNWDDYVVDTAAVLPDEKG